MLERCYSIFLDIPLEFFYIYRKDSDRSFPYCDMIQIQQMFDVFIFSSTNL